MTPREGLRTRRRGTAEEFDRRMAAFRTRLDAEMDRFLSAKRDASGTDRGCRELVDGVERLIRGGGKRLRPALVYHTYVACGGDDEGAVMPLALSTELFHTYLLIHDDIMDHAEVRRGRPSAHARFRELHREREWAGDSADFGRSVAILLGDLAHSWAVELFQSARAEARGSGDGRWESGDALDRCFAEMCEEVIRGQYLEMILPFRDEPAEEELLEVLRLKSGAYSVERPMELGTLLAGSPPELRESLMRYGRAVGEAFQLQDDILGTFGDSETVGKPVGSDLEEGKRTLLVHHSLRGASREDRRRLEELLGRPGLGREEVEEIRDIFHRSGGLAEVQRMIEVRLQRARRALESLSGDLEPEGVTFFDGLAEFLRERER